MSCFCRDVMEVRICVELSRKIISCISEEAEKYYLEKSHAFLDLQQSLSSLQQVLKTKRRMQLQ